MSFGVGLRPTGVPEAVSNIYSIGALLTRCQTRTKQRPHYFCVDCRLRHSQWRERLVGALMQVAWVEAPWRGGQKKSTPPAPRHAQDTKDTKKTVPRDTNKTRTKHQKDAPATRNNNTKKAPPAPRTMEADRAQANLGPAAEHAVPEEVPVAPKQPRRRFVGRKTAAAAAGGRADADASANMEDSTAIQGVRRLPVFTPACCVANSNQSPSLAAPPAH